MKTTKSGKQAASNAQVLTEAQTKQLEADARQWLAEVGTDTPKLALTPRRQQIMYLVARGLTNQEIAGELWISENTVKTLLRLMSKTLGATSRSRLALLYLTYLSAKERAAWRKTVSFKWPGSGITQHRMMWVMLSPEHCDATNAEIGAMLDISEATVKTHVRRLLNRMQGLPRNGQNLRVAAALHLPN